MKRMRDNVLSIFISFLAMAFYLMPLNTGLALGASDEGKVTHTATVGKFASVVGNVTQTRAKKVIKPVEKSSIQLNDIIATGKDSSVTIDFSDDSTIRLEQNSRLKISNFHFKKKSRRDILTLTTQGMANVTCTNGSLMLSALSADGKVTSTETLEAGQKAVIAGGAITISKIAAAVGERIANSSEAETARAAGGTSSGTGDKTASSGAATTRTGSGVTGDKSAAGGKEIKAATKVKHKPIKYFVEGKRIRLDAEVQDKVGIELVRCYFKGKADADYVFVTMNQGEIGEYSAILPAPDQNADMIEYLFLVVNKSNQVVKTQTFSVKRNLESSKTPSWQNLPLEGDIKVGIELGKAPEKLEGFSDSISMDIVVSSIRFGFVAGLYSSVQMAAAGGVGGGTAATATAGSGTAAAGGGTAATAVTATAGGTVTAAAGLSTAVIAGIAIGGAAVVGGVAAAAGRSSGGGTTTTTPTTTNPPPTTNPPNYCATAQTAICSVSTTTCSNCKCAGNCVTCDIGISTSNISCPSISATACGDTGLGYYYISGYQAVCFDIVDGPCVSIDIAAHNYLEYYCARPQSQWFTRLK